MARDLPKIMRTETTVRFQDCDPYGHLYNSKYIDYFMNAREDQVLEHYGLDIYALGATQGVGWVVAQNQIAYFEPANLMEKVAITTCIIQLSPRAMTVEFQMLNTTTGKVKAFLWTRFVHINLSRLTSIDHADDLMNTLNYVVVTLDQKTFEQRVKALRSEVNGQ